MIKTSRVECTVSPFSLSSSSYQLPKSHRLDILKPLQAFRAQAPAMKYLLLPFFLVVMVSAFDWSPYGPTWKLFGNGKADSDFWKNPKEYRHTTGVWPSGGCTTFLMTSACQMTKKGQEVRQGCVLYDRNNQPVYIVWSIPCPPDLPHCKNEPSSDMWLEKYATMRGRCTK